MNPSASAASHGTSLQAHTLWRQCWRRLRTDRDPLLCLSVVEVYVGRYAGKSDLSIAVPLDLVAIGRSEEHTSELTSLMRISYAVFFLKQIRTRELVIN